MCSSGDSKVKEGETQQLDFNKQLMGIFQTQFGKQSGILDYLSGKMKGNIANPQGYSPEALTSMRTAATEGTARSYAQAEQATHAQEAARGGSALPSGVNAQLDAQNANAAAAMNTGSQEQITQANENLKQQNYWNSVNAENGIAAGYNPQGYAGEANSGSGALAGLSNAYSTSQNSGFWNKLSGGFASGLGSGLGGALAGGIPGL